MKENFFIILSQSRENCQSSRRSPQESSQQLALFDPEPAEPLLLLKRQKPQISSTPGTSTQQRNRYRVTFQGQILGDKLSIDEAVELAKRGGR